MTDFVIVQTTYEHRDDALAAAKDLVERRLAACAQTLGPIASTYAWDGDVQQADEWLLAAKCRLADFDKCSDALLTQHPYDTPELVATPIVAGSAGYLQWLLQSTK